jgi:hypothetical protein
MQLRIEETGAPHFFRIEMTPGLCLDSGEFIPASELNMTHEFETKRPKEHPPVISITDENEKQQKRITELEAQLASGQEPQLLGRVELQREAKHPAPCASHCEAPAFKIEIRQLKTQIEVNRAQPPAQQPLSDAEQRELVKECGLDWEKGSIPLFAGDTKNRYAVLIEAVERKHSIKEKP